MGRWEPDSAGRLERAALELYAERGYDATTVADIAARAGLSERTFFRHYTDKREVLFAGAGTLQATLIAAVATAAPGTAPLAVLADALRGVAPWFDAHRDGARQRHRVITATPELQERELAKLTALAAALAGALRGRGTPDPAATLAADSAVAVFRLAFDGWVGDDPRPLGAVIDAVFAALRTVVSG